MNLMYLNYCMIIIVHNEMRWSYRYCWEMTKSYYALLELYTCHLLNCDQNVEGLGNVMSNSGILGQMIIVSN